MDEKWENQSGKEGEKKMKKEDLDGEAEERGQSKIKHGGGAVRGRDDV